MSKVSNCFFAFDMMLADIPWLFWGLLPLISLLYASVGHGGASGYLALMALFSFPVTMMKPAALLLNIFVAAISFYHYYKGGFFLWKLFISFAITSVPLAFIGGMIDLEAGVYKKILAILLLFAIARLLNIFGSKTTAIRQVKPIEGLVTGGAIGFFSGLIGIGGGIILGPVILLMRWGDMKQAAAVSALFIWVNSVAGIIGQWSQGAVITQEMFAWVLVAVVGGYIGGKAGSQWFGEQKLRYVLAFVLVLACVKLFLV